MFHLSTQVASFRKFCNAASNSLPWEEKLVMLQHHLRAISWPHWRHCSARYSNRSNYSRTRDAKTRKSSLASSNGFLPSSHFIAQRPSKVKSWAGRLSLRITDSAMKLCEIHLRCTLTWQMFLATTFWSCWDTFKTRKTLAKAPWSNNNGRSNFKEQIGECFSS